jgi:glycosyltransferase involved in cell wall biosynthesis
MATRYGFLSTHPPTFCGLATFNAALAGALTTGDSTGGVVRVGAELGLPGPEVVHTWTEAGEWRAAAEALNSFDVAVIQHEYGIYSGADGADVLRLMRSLTVPTIVVLHTVLSQPSPRQKSVLEAVVAAAGTVVTMTGAAHDRLLIGYAVDPTKVTVIPHGAAEHNQTPPSVRGKRPHLLTWGLLGPGKGIEWVIRALPHLRKLDPVYTVAGRTHPKVIERHGEAYRAGLHRLGAELGVAQNIDYQAIYHDQAALSALIRSADVVVLPYDSTEQVTSGVLVEAVAAGIPVVATPFPHAVELLTDGPGLVVPHRNPRALAAGVRKILARPALPAPAASPRWPEVAARYAALADRLIAAQTAAPAPAPA